MAMTFPWKSTSKQQGAYVAEPGPVGFALLSMSLHSDDTGRSGACSLGNGVGEGAAPLGSGEEGQLLATKPRSSGMATEGPSLPGWGVGARPWVQEP